MTDIREALVLVRSIIKEGAMTGFNPHDGDWVDRLFASQAVTHRALSAPPATIGVDTIRWIADMAKAASRDDRDAKQTVALISSRLERELAAVSAPQGVDADLQFYRTAIAEQSGKNSYTWMAPDRVAALCDEIEHLRTKLAAASPPAERPS